jgi:hypothetical protein
VVGHQPRPRCLAPREPPVGSLRPPSFREPPAGPLRPPGTPATLRPYATGSHWAKPQARSPVGVGRPKCPANKNNDKIYQNEAVK